MDKQTSFLTLFIFIFILTLFFFSSTVFARHPGFLFTRTRQNCTPQYWSSNKGIEEWPRMVPETSTVSKVFGSRAFERYGSDLTLLESTAMDEQADAYTELARQGSAALLNSYKRRKDYDFPYSPWEVKTAMIEGLVSSKAAALQARQFALANEACG